MKPALILHIPHSATHIPNKTGYVASDEALQAEILKLTDWHTEDLFASQSDLPIIAPFSRIFCDVERFPDDEHEVMAQFGMGALYLKTDVGAALREVSPSLRQHVMSEYYWPHHRRLSAAVAQQLELHGRAMIIDGHSFPDIPIEQSLDKRPNRPDFNIGTDAFHTPQALTDLSAKFFEDRGYSIGIDWPYSGSIVPLEYYQKDKRVSSIMLEVNRKLYLKEGTAEKSADYEQTKEVVRAFLAWLRAHFNQKDF
jgi:N-formylglutamate amidohydrolase